ncbi:hypothetical protein [Bradyrhizobium sp.]|uniref:hypothetical protein n=1 Tax=Bradyrhizobium sp. TaxID=376 RepID=UPI003C70C861
MLYLLATYWVWSVAALLAGGAVGYWLSGRRTLEEAVGRLGRWFALAFLLALAVAVLHWLPERAGLYLETLLLLAFCYAAGGLLGRWLRNARSRAISARAAEEARLAAAAKAAEARRSAAAKAAEQTRLALAAKAAEEERHAAAVKAAEEARQAAAAKAAEEARQAAAAKAAEAAAAVIETPAVAAVHAGTRPVGITVPEGGQADDLKLIKGIGPKNEKKCNALGIHYFRQIADWSPDEAIWVGHHLAFPGRIEREHWIAQARLLASGGDTDHSAGVKSGAIIVDDSADAPLDAAAADLLAKSLPQEAGAVEGEADHAGRRPLGLAAPLGGKPDDLKRIRGIGPQNEGRLHGLGIWHFAQIAAWREENVKWVGSYLAFRGRINREKWIEQASELAANRETEFSSRVAAGKVGSSKDDGSHGQGNVRTVK